MNKYLKWRHQFRNILVVPLRPLSTSGEGPPQRNVSAVLDRVKRDLELDKQKLTWRTPIGNRPEDWNSKLKAFYNSEQNSDFIIMMQQPLNLSPRGLMEMWAKRKENIERQMQQYIPERHQVLGADLAASHFLLHRGGAVRFVNGNRWQRINKDGIIDLPNRFNPAYKVEAIRCDNMKLFYEGLENIRCLYHLKFLSFHNVTTFDDWCLDRVSGSEFVKLEVLDLSGTQCTSNGLSCLYRIPTLKLLIVNDPKVSLEYELTCAMLEEVIPNLKIVSATEVHAEDAEANINKQ